MNDALAIYRLCFSHSVLRAAARRCRLSLSRYTSAVLLASPIWLLGLLPWAGMVLYLLPGRGTPAVVPFIALWNQTLGTSRRTRRRWPGTATLFGLLAMLLAIVAASQPARRVVGITAPEISIVLDRGATMSLPSASGKPFRNVIDRVGPVRDQTRVTLVPVPGQTIDTSGTAWTGAASALSPTAVPTQLDQVVSNQLRKTRGPVYVLSDQHLNLSDERIVQIFPEKPEPTAAIVSIGASLQPHPQVMARLENHSDLRTISLLVQSGDVAVNRIVDLPPPGQAGDRFIDLPALAGTAVATIDLGHQHHPWTTAQLARASHGIRIVLEPGADDAIRRIAQIYSRNRPGDAEAETLLISDHSLDPGQRGIWVNSTLSRSAGSAAPLVAPNELTRNITAWPGPGTSKIPADFQSIVAVAGEAIVAIREKPVRQVWLNANLRDWEKTPDFVVFFATAFDWIGRSDMVYSAELPTAARESPGVYHLPSGSPIAVNAGPFPGLPVEQRSAAQSGRQVPATTPLTGEFSVTALVCLLIAGSLWSRK